MSDRRFYSTSVDLDKWIEDPSVDIRNVVAEIERACCLEAHAADYYRDHPELLSRGHPWLRFVETGLAAYLGWDVAEVGRSQ